ncbi:g9730 [Coccomyxa viridis]|uniref:G9730 protein n=1 Tax=Coccomyxa viridis TaxID=1274662 RepID=A0ABP1G6C9_9CHLO
MHILIETGLSTAPRGTMVSNRSSTGGRRQVALGKAFTMGEKTSAFYSQDGSGTQRNTAQCGQSATPTRSRRAAAQGARKRMKN